MKYDFKELMKNYETEAIKTLQSFVQIDSVYRGDTVAKNMPFGEGVYKALTFIGKVAEKDGFSVDYCDGYATEISCGSGDKLIAIYAHADVVPVSGVWKHPAFSATIENDVMYGRGTGDDKGPGIAAYYALKALRDAHLIDGYKVTMVFGGNEENGSACLKYYFDELKKPYPTYGFTPDADFPLIYGEKGITNYLHQTQVDLFPVISINAGTASNVVIDTAEAIIAQDDKIEDELKKRKLNYSLQMEKDTMRLTIYGKSAHGSTPELGINAGLELIAFLGEYYDLAALKNLASLYADPFGKAMNLYFESENLHETTYNVGIIEYVDTVLRVTVNFRYPETVNGEEIVERINEKTLVPTEIISTSPYLYFDPESPFIKALYQVYVEETGDTVNKPMTIGGGTYAKESKNTIAFGAAFPGKDNLFHSPNEHFELNDLRQSMAIYAHAIFKLGHEL